MPHLNLKYYRTIARKIIENNIKYIAKIVSLSVKDYFKILEKMSDFDLRCGIVYDAIIVECALKSKVDEILTLNPKDFSCLTKDNPIRITSF